MNNQATGADNNGDAADGDMPGAGALVRAVTRGTAAETIEGCMEEHALKVLKKVSKILGRLNADLLRATNPQAGMTYHLQTVVTVVQMGRDGKQVVTTQNT